MMRSAQNSTHETPAMVRSATMQNPSASHPNERPIPSTYAPARDAAGHAPRRDPNGAHVFSRVEGSAGVVTSIAAGNGGEAVVRGSMGGERS